MFAPKRLSVTLFLASAFSACGSDDVGAEADAGSRADASSAVRIEVPATDGELVVDFGISVTGDGSMRVGQISVLNGSGSIEIFGASVDVAVYEEQPWPGTGYSLYQALAVAEDRWYVAWFYCENQELQYIYVEGTDGSSLAYETASGTCSIESTPSAVSVRFPEVDMPRPNPIGRFEISGPDISLHGLAPGTVRIDETEWVLLPFQHVNCTGGCEVGTWYELHAVLSLPEAQRAAFGIFYMTVGDPDSVALEYALSLPDLDRLGGTTIFTADWIYD